MIHIGVQGHLGIVVSFASKRVLVFVDVLLTSLQMGVVLNRR
jgi:hypothetical protein